MKTKITILVGVFLLNMGFFTGPHTIEKEFNIYDYSWLAGRWVGDGFGGTSEEIWSPPSADGTMMGMYRHHKADGTLNFYEFFVLDKTGIRLKHFTPTMVGWETKENYVTFEMMNFSPDKIELDGLIMERKSNDEMKVQLQIKQGDKEETVFFNMKRAQD
jgi:hypothetical protein